MTQDLRDILQQHGLSRLADLPQTEMLEKVTGDELAAMFSLASKSFPHRNMLWSSEEMEPPELQNTQQGDDCTKTQFSYKLSNVDQQNVDRVASPVPHPSPSPPPRVAYHHSDYRYYQMFFAGFKLPVLTIGCYEPVSQTKKICPFGGSKEGERYFLSSWRYEIFRIRC